MNVRDRRVAVGVSLGLVLLAVGVAFALREERRHLGNETLAVRSLRAVVTAQTMFMQRDADGNGLQDFAPDLAMLGAPAHGGLIDEALASGEKSGYRFRLARGGDRWCATADPVEPGITGDAFYWVDQEGLVHRSPLGAPTSAPLTLGVGPPAGWTAVR